MQQAIREQQAAEAARDAAVLESSQLRERLEAELLASTVKKTVCDQLQAELDRATAKLSKTSELCSTQQQDIAASAAKIQMHAAETEKVLQLNLSLQAQLHELQQQFAQSSARSDERQAALQKLVDRSTDDLRTAEAAHADTHTKQAQLLERSQDEVSELKQKAAALREQLEAARREVRLLEIS